jgi:hypothetical protein
MVFAEIRKHYCRTQNIDYEYSTYKNYLLVLFSKMRIDERRF